MDAYPSEREARRDFLKQLTAASLAALAATEPRPAQADTKDSKVDHPRATADACILLWMAGGMAAPDTFDPKRYVPFEVGVQVEKVLSTFPSIPTAVDGVRISEGLEHVAKVLDRGTLIRSHLLPDLGHILHSRHQYHWHTGYVPPQTVAAPHLGAWIARVLGPRDPAMPAFIDIGQRLEGVGGKEGLKAFHPAGFLGSEYGPFLLPYPDQAIQAVRPPRGMNADRFQERYRRYQELLKRSPQGAAASDYQRASMLLAVDNAHRLLGSPRARAFDLALEPKENYEAYNTGRFGLGCLLARRLV